MEIIVGLAIGFIIGVIVMIFTASVFSSYLYGLNKELKKENAKLRKELLSYDEICEINEEVK